MKKRFYIFEVDAVEQNDAPGGFRFVETIAGTISEARDAIRSEAYKAGQYIILEDTSGLVTKATETVTKTAVTFEPSRKKPRKEKVVAMEPPAKEQRKAAK